MDPTEPQQPCGTAPPSVHRFTKTSPETVPDPLFRSPWSMQVGNQYSTCACEVRTEPREPLIWRVFLVLAAETALPGCAGRFSAVRKPQMCVFGAEPPPVQPPQGRSGKFQTRFSPVTTGAAGQSSGSRSPEAALPDVRSRRWRSFPLDGAPAPGIGANVQLHSEMPPVPLPRPDPPRQSAERSRPRRAGPPSPAADAAVAPCGSPSDASAQCGLPVTPRGSGRPSAPERSRGASCGRIQGLQRSIAEGAAWHDPPKKAWRKTASPPPRMPMPRPKSGCIQRFPRTQTCNSGQAAIRQNAQKLGSN